MCSITTWSRRVKENQLQCLMDSNMGGVVVILRGQRVEAKSIFIIPSDISNQLFHANVSWDNLFYLEILSVKLLA